MNVQTLQDGESLVARVTDYVKAYMANYDASHDFAHIQRVVGLAQHIYQAESVPEAADAAANGDDTAAASPVPTLDLLTITLSGLLHDVGDRKYLKSGEDGTTMVLHILLGFGCPEPLARTVQAICSGVSYSGETKDPTRVARLIVEHPELAVVQDADRLDAIGAVGIGRLFTYGGARTSRSMEAGIEHLDEKLLRLEGMMKTAEGRRLARARTERLTMFRQWWHEEAAVKGAFLGGAGLPGSSPEGVHENGVDGTPKQ